MRKKLYSHGPKSDLIDHTIQVADGPRNDAEKISRLCHDVIKATVEWQGYIVRKTASDGVKIKSPHRHAIAGGLLACAVLRILKYDLKWQIAALHSGAAHHSFLQSLNPGEEYEKHLAPAFRSEQAKGFFTDMLRKYAQVPELVAEEAWKRCAELRPAPMLPAFWAQFQQEVQALSANECLEISFTIRDWLGEMVRLDHLSAAAQTWGTLFKPEKTILPAFKARKPPEYTTSTDLHVARNNILAETLRLPSSRFYVLIAATGLAKTNAMTSKGEHLIVEHGLKKLVYAVPTTSIGDQIFLEYLHGGLNSQIFDHRRKERLEDREDKEEQTLEPAEEPFGSHYNVTTFNQVFLAMLHPQRFQCVKNGGLEDAVVILDEFHKLPFHLQRPLLAAANAYSSRRNLYFILGSATAIPVDRWVSASAIPRETLAKIHSIPFIRDRRVYHKIGKRRPEELLDTIHQLHKQSTLVVVNLVKKGTFPLSNIMGIGANPFRRIGSFPLDREQIYKSLPSWRGIKTLIIDSTMQPFLRKRIIPIIKSIIQSGKEILVISTQIIEVGVDLNFETGIIDWQGLASTLQRGGRVGREGGGLAKDVYVFELIDDSGRTSYQTLMDVFSLPAVSEFAKYLLPMNVLLQQEATWFRRWDSKRVFKDQDLTEQLETLVNHAHDLTQATDWRELLKPKPGSQPTLGLDMAALQYLAQIYGEEDPGESIVLFESEEAYLETKKLIDSKKKRDVQEASMRINERRINSYHAEVLDAIVADTISLPSLQETRCFLQQ